MIATAIFIGLALYGTVEFILDMIYGIKRKPLKHSKLESYALSVIRRASELKE